MTQFYFEPPINEGYFRCHGLVHWELFVTGWYSCWCDAAGMFIKSDTLKGLKDTYKEETEKQINLTEKSR